MIPSTKAVLFDIGNVLLKLKSQDFLQRFCAACQGLSAEKLVEELSSESGQHFRYERGEIEGGQFHRHLVQSYRLSWSYEEFAKHWNDYFEPNPAMEALVEKLQPQTRLWALSNTNALHFSVFHDRSPVFARLEGILGSHQVGLRKPDPRIFQKALELMGLKAGEVFYIDDLAANAQAAGSLGFNAFLYHFNDQELRSALRQQGLDV